MVNETAPFERLRGFTPFLTIANTFAALLATLGYREASLATILVLNPLWLLIYSVAIKSKRWFGTAVAFAVAGQLVLWLVLLVPKADILVSDSVRWRTPVTITYDQVPLTKHLWLAVNRGNKFWTYGI